MTKRFKEHGYFGDLRRKKGARICCGGCAPSARCALGALEAGTQARCASRAFSTALA